MCSCGLRSCGGHGSGTAVSSPYAAEPTPDERAQRIAKAVRKQSIEVKENWEQLKTRASNWQKQVEKALEKLQELQKALDDLEADVTQLRGSTLIGNLWVTCLLTHCRITLIKPQVRTICKIQDWVLKDSSLCFGEIMVTADAGECEITTCGTG
ncbi:utrophin-like [Stegostoma tigrinum]|uniref:utrophin-like n=1 Tax=Stegostoma tigrinum TaxID=3053191 RepID=UPI00286FE4F0|nr:utrophin-like [Stegostoma tigrinum]